MITGFNTNVRHRGRMFHVQTEDSGREHPHVISHVYFRGTILASEKQEYSEWLGRPDLSSQVRRLMDEQHRAMVERLKAGELDATIAERLDAGSEAPPAKAAAPRPDARRAAAPAPQPAPAPPSEVAAAVTERPRAFGEGIVSEKPLDEVILDYLVEKARSRSSEPAPRPIRRPPE